MQAGQELRLALELPLVGFGEEQVLFDRTPDAEADVPGVVDRAHAALAKLGIYAIAIMEVLADSERHDATTYPAPSCLEGDVAEFRGLSVTAEL